MTLADRVAAFPANAAAWPHLVKEQGRDVLYARWLAGANYRNAGRYYGAYPRSYMEKLMALFPDMAGRPQAVLHGFSGSLAAGPYVRLDIRHDIFAGVTPDVVGSVYAAATALRGRGPFELIVVDPPYSDDDAERYGSPMIDRLRTAEALGDVAAPRAYMAWLDTCWPQHSKRQWVTVGRVAVTRSTNHRARDLTLFERTAH